MMDMGSVRVILSTEGDFPSTIETLGICCRWQPVNGDGIDVPFSTRGTSCRFPSIQARLTRFSLAW
ncbi:MAG TPA: hypothetical protein PLX97_09565, partial [Gemmatales bacterium]|nr:hypothetical protein [Gemmatales bacterium]